MREYIIISPIEIIIEIIWASNDCRIGDYVKKMKGLTL